MKINLKGIKFKTWLYFLGFSISTLVLLGLLLVLLIKPYYRNDRINTVNNIEEVIADTLINNNSDVSEIEKTSKMLISNNVCLLLYNQNGESLYEKDTLGQLCQLDKDIRINDVTINAVKNPKALIDYLNSQVDFNQTTDASLTGSSMLLSGKKIAGPLANYYLVINTPLEPIESYVDFILNQYLYIAVVIIVIALFLSYVLASKIAGPIIKMKKEADKLAEGHYDADFNQDSFTEINDLATTLDDATDKLSKIDELRKDLIANVSHDIKTPLTMIKAYAEMIKDISGDDPVKRNEHIDVIIKETDYLTSLVTDMQEYSKMQAGVIELKNTNFDLMIVIEKVVGLLMHLMEEKQITLQKNLSSVIVFGDETKISQVIYNYLSNAIKHSENNQKIIINEIVSEETVRVEVIDFGDGIKEEMQPYIWDRYYKIDKGFQRTKNSSGLGLAIAKAILEAHKAKYGVISKENQGSTFYFELSRNIENDEGLS